LALVNRFFNPTVPGNYNQSGNVTTAQYLWCVHFLLFSYPKSCKTDTKG